MNAAHPSAWSLIWTVASREITVKLRDKAFLIMTGVLLLVMGISVAIPMMMTSQTPSLTLAVSGQGARQVADAATQLGAQGTSSPMDAYAAAAALPSADITVDEMSPDAARQAVREGEANAALVGDSLTDLTLVGDTGISATLQALVDSGAAVLQQQRAAADAGLTDAQMQQIFAPTLPATELLGTSPTGDLPPILIIMVFGFLYFLSTIMFGNSISQSVVEEKQSRVVEILMAAVPVRWLLTGKVLGNTILAFGQVALLVVVGLVGLNVAGYGSLVSGIAGASAWFLVFFVLGFVMLACLWAAAGAMASRVEELSGTTGIIQVLVMLPFFAALFLQDPSPLQTVLSYVPFTSTLVMPARLIMGAAAPWEPLVAAAIVVVTAIALIWVSVRLYLGSVMHTASAMKLSQAWKASQD